MTSQLNHWTTDPEYIELLNFVIEKTKDAKSPLNIIQLAREFKEKSGSVQVISRLRSRIDRLRLAIRKLQHIDTDTKVKILFALSAPVHEDFLIELRNQANLVLDRNNVIIEYRKYGGGLELRRKQTQVKNFPSININDWESDEEYVELFHFLIEKTNNVKSPLNIRQLAKDFKAKSGSSRAFTCFIERIECLRSRVHEMEMIDMATKVKMLFGLSASIDENFFNELQPDAIVGVDEKNRITRYKAKDGSMELEGDHSQSAKSKAEWAAREKADVQMIKIEQEHPEEKPQEEKSHSYSKQISNYFANKDADKGELGELIEFLTEKCENVGSAMTLGMGKSTFKLAKEFNRRSVTSISLGTTMNRIRGYCREIQKLGCLDTPTKVKQLLGLGASLNPEFLEELRKDAIVEVDDQNRLTSYVANDGSFILKNRGSDQSETKCSRVGKRKGKKGSDEDSDGYSSEEVNSEFDPNYYGPSTKIGEESEKMSTRSGIVPKKRVPDIATSYQNRYLNRRRAFEIFKKATERNSETARLEYHDLVSNVFQVPETKLNPALEFLIDDFASINPDNDTPTTSSSELREPKKEIEEEAQIDFETMEFLIKTEEDLIIPKLEELESDN